MLDPKTRWSFEVLKYHPWLTPPGLTPGGLTPLLCYGIVPSSFKFTSKKYATDKYISIVFLIPKNPSLLSSGVLPVKHSLNEILVTMIFLNIVVPKALFWNHGPFQIYTKLSLLGQEALDSTVSSFTPLILSSKKVFYHISSYP